MPLRHPLSGCILAAALAAAAGCFHSGLARDPARRAARLRRIDAALERAGRYLIAKQSPDGAWRSEKYGCFREGPELTGYVMSCLFFIPGTGGEGRGAYRRGVDYLVGLVEEDGSIRTGPHGLNFPVYSAASASRVVVLQQRSERNLRAQGAWLAYLRERQLTEKLGWKRSDREYGGWGFAMGLPRKPEPGRMRGRLVESNLSATIFGIAALRSARVPPGEAAYAAALAFAKRCQNYPDDPARADSRFDDGGFFFIPDDPLQNKAGVAGTDRFKRRRFASYGSMTADGLRALVRCGLAPDHPRVMAARRWLERNFTVATNPGDFADDREVLRNATYYYYVWSLAHAFMGLGLREIETPRGRVDWAATLADELIRRQEADGSWINQRFTDAKEDDPLVATPWAAAALAICRHVLHGMPGGGRGCAPPKPSRGHPAGVKRE